MRSACTLSALGVPVVLAAVLAAAPSGPAGAGPFTIGTSRNYQDTATDVTVTGEAGERFSITYVDEDGVTRSKTVTIATALTTASVPAKKGTTITVRNLSQPERPAQTKVASRFDPPGEVVVTALTVDPGSALTAFGDTFVLSGGFTAFGTDVVYDPTAPDFGMLSGILPQSRFSLSGTGATGTVLLALDADHPWSIDLGAAWDADVPDSGLILPYSQGFTGTLTFGALTMPFAGTIAGTVTFFRGGRETVAGTFDLGGGLGTGRVSATGASQLVQIAEPASLLLVVSALGLFAALSRRG